MKSNKFIKKCGPYYVTTHSQNAGLVYARLFPAFPQYDLSAKRITDNDVDPIWKADPHWARHRANGDGGGPSIFTSMALGDELKGFLNQSYDTQRVLEWENIATKILDGKDKDIVFMSCKHCATVTTAPKEWKFCPICGGKLTYVYSIIPKFPKRGGVTS